jgi:medium-chain acyl-[acyl-carrier-protein] hydrolase
MRMPWLVNRKRNQRASVRLFCFPYAGGGDSIFRSWQETLSDTIEVCPVQLPGRGSRISEPPYTEMDQLVRGAGEALAPYFDKPFALFGHSMGALIAYELARYVRREYSVAPVHLFVSARCSPQTMSEPLDLEELDCELPEMLRLNKGTPEEVLDNPELMDVVLPILRADIVLCNSYIYTPGPPFSFSITAFGGLDDHGVPRHCIEGWREHTTGPFVLRMLPGDHFFVNTSGLPLLEAISKELEQDMREKGRHASGQASALRRQF